MDSFGMHQQDSFVDPFGTSDGGIKLKELHGSEGAEFNTTSMIDVIFILHSEHRVALSFVLQPFVDGESL